MAKTICQCQYTKKNRSRKNGDKDGKALYKLMNNAVYGKTMENLRNRIDVKLINNEEDYLKCYMTTQAICHTKYLAIIQLGYVKTNLN